MGTGLDKYTNIWFSWENLALFDFTGELLSSISAFDSTATSIDEDISKINEFKLDQNYPNPYNPKTSIQYSISNKQFVTLKVYNLLGREVATLVNENKEAGNYMINLDASILPSGVYIYKLQAGDYVQTRKMTLVK